MRPLVSAAWSLLTAAGLLACGQSGGGGDLAPPACLPDGMEVAPAQLDLVVASTASFGATVTASCASEPVSAAKVTFLSRDAGVATVASTSDTTAEATGVAEGVAYVVATCALTGCTAADSVRIQVTSCAGTTVLPGASLQALVDAAPAGMTFCLHAGTYHRQQVSPKRGMRFIGVPCRGAMLDGDSVAFVPLSSATYAFRTDGAAPVDSVTIKCLTIQRYLPEAQMGAIKGGGHTLAEGGRGWIVDSNEVRNNGNLGLRLGNRWLVRGNFIHHNGTLGIGGVTDTTEIRGNEIAYNNAANAGTLGFEAGGTKFVLSHGLRLVGNSVHHNMGPGLWLDTDNDASVIDSNTVEDNLQEGIVSEISYSALIRDNSVNRNGLGDVRRTTLLWGAGIGIHASGGSGIEVTGNRLSGNAHGIGLIQQTRGTGAMGPHLVQNVNVHGNTITMGPGSLSAAGAVQDLGDNAIFTSRNNRFTDNAYNLPGAGSVFHWANALRTDAQWMGLGNDVGGVFNR